MNAVQTVERLLDQMKAAALSQNMVRHEAVSDELATLVMAYIVPLPEDRWEGMHLSRTERRIADLLMTNLGKVTSRDALLNALYFDDPNGGAEAKIVDVYVCKLRKKLEDSGQFHIETLWGQGYSLKSGAGPRSTYFQGRSTVAA